MTWTLSISLVGPGPNGSQVGEIIALLEDRKWWGGFEVVANDQDSKRLSNSLESGVEGADLLAMVQDFELIEGEVRSSAGSRIAVVDGQWCDVSVSDEALQGRLRSRFPSGEVSIVGG